MLIILIVLFSIPFVFFIVVSSSVCIYVISLIKMVVRDIYGIIYNFLFAFAFDTLLMIHNFSVFSSRNCFLKFEVLFINLLYMVLSGVEEDVSKNDIFCMFYHNFCPDFFAVIVLKCP